MNLRKRAISGIMLAGSMVVMCAIADAACCRTHGPGLGCRQPQRLGAGVRPLARE